MTNLDPHTISRSGLTARRSLGTMLGGMDFVGFEPRALGSQTPRSVAATARAEAGCANLARSTHLPIKEVPS